MTTLTREDHIIKKLQQKHGLSEDEARWLLARLQKSLALDIIDVDTGLPVALIEDEALEDGDVSNGCDTMNLDQG